MRFRSAPGTAREIGFLFYAMAVGMGFLSLGAIITLVVGGAIFILERARFGKRDSTERMLRITIPEDLNYTGIFDDLFQTYTTLEKAAECSSEGVKETQRMICAECEKIQQQL